MGVQVVESVEEILHLAELVSVLAILRLDENIELLGAEEEGSASHPPAEGEEDSSEEQRDEGVGGLFFVVAIS